MNIVLGYWLDSATYPDALGNNKASLGTVVTGFNGLIGILETQLGLTFPHASENLRIAQWQELIRSQDTGDKPFSNSYSTDSWNTAKELLRRRDELVLGGWEPATQQDGSIWIGTLAELELANKNKIWGFSDRVRALLAKLQENNMGLNIESITIIDEDESLWDPWAHELIQLLKGHGVPIGKEPAFFNAESEPPSVDSDLSRLQSVLAGKKTPSSTEAKGDGSLLLVRSEQEWDAADFLSSWLQINGSEDTVLIKNHGSLMLDELLHRHGVAAAGAENPSKWRAVLQVLPLTIDTYWQPLRVERLMELLTIPTSPLPKTIRYKLAKALADEPGIGGPKWNEALERGIQEIEEQWKEQGDDEQEIKKRRKDLTATLELWLNHEYYDPNIGIPYKKIAHICQKVSSWAAKKYHATNEGIYAEAIVFADEVIEGLKTLGVDTVTRLQVVRILESVLGEGAKLEKYGQEAAQWHVVEHPGQIWGKADTILWWGFHKNASGPNIRTWTKKEREWLQNHGVYLTDDDVRRRREAASWQRAARLAKKRLILFSPARVQGEEITIHPLWDEIRFAVARDHSTESKITVDASVLRKGANPNIAGNQFERVARKVRKLPEPIRDWKAPENILTPRPEESATSFESLVGCPLQWTLKYGANVRQGSVLSLPNESLMLGNLGHTILERLIMEKADWNEDEVTIRVVELFDELTPMLAAPLLEPKNSITRNQTRRKLQKAIGQFFKVLNSAGITIKHTEIEMKKPWNDDVEFKGRMDLVGETPTGRRILFDAKWSRKPDNYRKRLENGSIQLSLYHWLLTEKDGEELPVAYFILSSGDFFSSEDDEFPADYHVQGPSLSQSYQIVRKAVEDVWSQLLSGMITAPGIPEGDEEADNENNQQRFMPIIDPPCAFCEYKNLCGVGRVRL